MKKRNVIILTILMILVTGCSQNDKKNEVGAKAGIDSIDYKDSENKKNETDQTDENTETSKSENDKSNIKPDSTSGKQNEDTTISKQSNSSQVKPDTSNKETKQQPSQQQEQAKQEQTKPETTKSAEPKPSVPVCDDSLPAGAYPMEREAEIDAKVQAEMIDNQVNGDGTFKQYEVEYGMTECGTEYFYIIYYKY